jgi:hypothetical protein
MYYQLRCRKSTCTILERSRIQDYQIKIKELTLFTPSDPFRPTLLTNSLESPIVEHCMELGKQSLFFLVYMAIVVGVVHDLLIFARRDLKITDGVVDEFFQAGCGAAWLFH